ncbi:MAG: NAD-glutamate dehydrogenase [Hyphomonadaceae bacterium]|nr:NAD-glutamate dehydrogenase [Hyphomonadaceae bacterium]
MDTGARGDLAVNVEDFLSRAGMAGRWPAFKAGARLAPAAAQFLAGFHDDASIDELGDLGIDDLISLAHEFWAWRVERKAGEQSVRIRPANGVDGRVLKRDILEIVGPDMPFLVDSVMGELTDHGVSALALFHPIVRENGAAESLIQVHMPTLSPARAAAIADGVAATLKDVRAAVGAFAQMKERMLDRAQELSRASTDAPREAVDESVAFLRWLAADRFTFLGARDYAYVRGPDGRLQPGEPIILEETGIGLLADPERYVLRTSNEPLVITPEIRTILEDPTPLIVAKSTLRSRVHRRAPADYIGVKRYNAAGDVVGETRFVGLFASDAYTESTREVPLIRRKVAWVLEAAGFPPGGHKHKTMRNVLETYPRDELWQVAKEELLRIAKGVMHLLDRPRARAFNRRDPFNRFVTAIAYLPKDRFNSTLREAVGGRLEAAYGGRVEAYHTLLSDGPLARVFYVIGEIDRARAEPDQQILDDEIAALTHTWEDGFEDALVASPFDEAAREEIRHRYAGAFSAGYRDRYDAEESLVDIAAIANAREDAPVHVRAYRIAKDTPEIVRCKIYSRGEVLPLSAMVPILENMGLFVTAEVNFAVRLASVAGKPELEVHIHELKMRSGESAAIDLKKVGLCFEDAFAAVWTGQAENDGFNRLILKLPAQWRDAALLRALARFRQQTGLDPSQPVQEEALAANPHIAALILELFAVRFDPANGLGQDARAAQVAEIEAKIDDALNAVASLDSDRVLRRIAKLVGAITRTNFYARKSCMSFKIASRTLDDLPLPKPYREIWVSSPQVEGVHLRFGPVARGGLRWTDRRDDFRTEVLDLVKAQQVKNSIIVPVGAKGGFFPKQLPARGAPGFLEAGQAAYRTFLRGLLDITDNIAGAEIVPPKNVVRWDADDPYLVVAADKGTATFSDIANSISAEYGHWLGDAFASGGSAGYDHKAMGITAKGAWEAVKRHFREIGKNIQEEPFTMIGVGDMSGDVFGNGVLLSRQIRLVAAFDHRDIFIDPAPDPEASWIERKRMFDLPRSSWQDYTKSLISQGGGVFSRSLKAVPLSPEMQALAGLSAKTATPAELISALLKAPAELLWFGGIGTFVKAKAESHAEVGDKANDGVRVDAEDVAAQIIAEGANLGITQAGRIAFARKGGRINSDAVDNSAGVDTSDHEVNIKILLADAIGAGALKSSERDALLADMTDEVARLVLIDNYDQTKALSLAQATASADLDAGERMIERLERSGKLIRRVEGLPSAEEFRARRAAGQGLARPELSKLLAYGKIDLFDALVASPAPDDPHFEGPLVHYFPTPLKRFEPQMRRHRLRREIIATYLADDLINMGGPTFVDRMHEAVHADPVSIACAFEASRHILRLDDFFARVDALDNLAPAKVQTDLCLESTRALRRATTYLVRHGGLAQGASPGRTIEDLIAFYRPQVDAQRDLIWASLTTVERRRAEARRGAFQSAGAPADVALHGAALSPLAAALDVADIAARRNWPAPAAAFLYRALGAEFGIDRLVAAAMGLSLDQHWDRLAARRATEDLFDRQRALAEAALAAIGAPPDRPDAEWGTRAAAEWAASLGAPAESARRTLAELEGQGGWTFAKLVIAAAEMHALAGAVEQ